MKQNKFGICVVLFFLSSLLPLRAQLGGEVTSLTVTYANGEQVKAKGRNGPLRTLAIGAGETVNLRLDLPASFLNLPLVAQALDGGRLAREAFPLVNGIVTTSFQAGTQPGLYRVLFCSLDNRTTMLRFRVRDPENPSAHSTAVASASQGGVQ